MALLGEDVPGSDNDLRGLRWALGADDAVTRSQGLAIALALRNAMWIQGRWREYTLDVGRAIEVSRDLEDLRSLAKLLVYQAGLREALADWRGCMLLARNALRIGREPETRADALFRLGAASHSLGHSRRARSQLQAALALATDEARQSAIKLKLCRAERALGNAARASELLQEVHDWAETKSSPWFLAEVLLERAGEVREIEPDAALSLAKRGLQTYRDLGFNRGVAYANLELARVHQSRGDCDAAVAHLGVARSLFEQMQYEPGLAHVHLGFGLLALEKGRPVEALASFEKSQASAARVHYSRGRARATGLAVWSAWKARSWRACAKHALLFLWTILLFDHRAGRALFNSSLGLLAASRESGAR